MKTNSLSLLDAIHTGAGLRLRDPKIKQISGGDIHQAFRVGDADESLFVKVNQIKYAPLLIAEALGLETIAATHTVHTPEVLGCEELDGMAYLILEHVQFTTKSSSAAKKFGQQLAAMHKFTSTEFGFEQNNWIGLSKQRNDWQTGWWEFWCQHRLGTQLKLAKQNNASTLLFELGEQLMEVVVTRFGSHQPQPSLLHGDLWGGNWAVDEHGKPLTFDPAVYYGDRETDLAMCALFGGFSPEFFHAYNESWPLLEGWQQRRPLYQLYHVLNHFNLFGGRYDSQSCKLMTEILGDAC